MKNIISILIIALMGLGLMSCGKRGDLLPPEGYQAPKE